MAKTLRFAVTAACIGAIAACVGCKSSPDRTTGQQISDHQIARAVKKSLDNDPTFKYANVYPNVYAGTIQLSGFVETPEQRLRAAELAAEAKGAKQVINQIMLKPTPVGRVTIRDPLGQETGRLLVDTNVPIQQLRNIPGQPSEQPQEQKEPAAKPEQNPPK